MKLSEADLFCGIGGIRLGFERTCSKLGVDTECVYSCDIHKAACKVYQDRFKDGFSPLGDITKINPELLPAIDVVLAGFPCVSFSIAGAKKGFEDARGTLFYDLAKILKAKSPKAFLFENVDHLLKIDKGRTFQTMLRILETELGYNVYYRVLNAAKYGLAQNRRRVYIVGFKGIGKGFVFPGGSAGDGVAKIADIMEKDPVHPRNYLSKRYWETLKRHRANHEAKGQGFGYVVRTPDDVASTIMKGGMGRERNLLIDKRTTDFSSRKTEVNSESVRFMTPLEWERLQGFPDGWCDAAPISSRMGLLGNSVAVPVVEAISERIVAELLDPKPFRKVRDRDLFSE
jgi:DNA (cytosine-5)-methyltransferase 1